jgi:methionyl-tRNA formyltransferase
MNILFIGSAGPLSVITFRSLCEADFSPCAVAVDAGDDRFSQHRDLPVVTEDQGSIEALAHLSGIPIIKLSRHGSEATRRVEAFSPDIIFVSCFARKIPDEVLSVPAIGCFNLHPSTLPAYRGPSPIFWQFRDGVSEMGVTLHRMSAQLDGGNIIGQTPVAIPNGVTMQQASVLLAEAGGQLLVQALSRHDQASWIGFAQQEEGASYQGFPSESDYAVSTGWPAKRLFNFICATHAPGVVYPCTVGKRTFELVEAISFQETGEVRLVVEGDELVLPCRSGFVRARFLKI